MRLLKIFNLTLSSCEGHSLFLAHPLRRPCRWPLAAMAQVFAFAFSSLVRLSQVSGAQVGGPKLDLNQRTRGDHHAYPDPDVPELDCVIRLRQSARPRPKAAGGNVPGSGAVRPCLYASWLCARFRPLAYLRHAAGQQQRGQEGVVQSLDRLVAPRQAENDGDQHDRGSRYGQVMMSAGLACREGKAALERSGGAAAARRRGAAGLEREENAGAGALLRRLDRRPCWMQPDQERPELPGGVASAGRLARCDAPPATVNLIKA